MSAELVDEEMESEASVSINLVWVKRSTCVCAKLFQDPDTPQGTEVTPLGVYSVHCTIVLPLHELLAVRWTPYASLLVK